MKTFERSLLIVTFIVAFLGIIHLIPKIASIVLALVLLIYLFSGWYLLLPNRMNNTKRWFPFLVSYLIAQTILTILFGINNWPLKEIISYVTLTAILIFIGFLFINKKSFAIDYPINQYLLRLIICSMFCSAPLWM